MDAVTTAESPARSASGRRGWIVVVLLIPATAVAWWLIGYLPWIVAGLSDGTPYDSGAGSIAMALPLTTPRLQLLVLGALVGGMTAGLVALAARRHRMAAVAATFVGLGIGVGAALWQSWTAVERAVHSEFAADPRVLTALAIITVGVTALGWIIGALGTLARPLLGVAIAVLAGAASWWLVGVVPGDFLTGLVWDWAGPVVLVVGLVVVGVRPRWRLALWPLAIAAAWLVGPALLAANYVAPMLRPGANLPNNLPDVVDAGQEMFVKALTLEADWRPLAPAIVGIVVAAALAAFLAWREVRD